MKTVLLDVYNLFRGGPIRINSTIHRTDRIYIDKLVQKCANYTWYTIATLKIKINDPNVGGIKSPYIMKIYMDDGKLSDEHHCRCKNIMYNSNYTAHKVLISNTMIKNIKSTEGVSYKWKNKGDIKYLKLKSTDYDKFSTAYRYATRHQIMSWDITNAIRYTNGYEILCECRNHDPGMFIKLCKKYISRDYYDIVSVDDELQEGEELFYIYDDLNKRENIRIIRDIKELRYVETYPVSDCQEQNKPESEIKEDPIKDGIHMIKNGTNKIEQAINDQFK